MKRRDFVATSGGLLGLSLAGFGQIKEGDMQKESVPDPKQVFLSTISAIREKFQRCFNENDWAEMEKLYWEDAVLVSEETNEVHQGRQKIVEFWRNFKEQKHGRALMSIKPRSERPLLRTVELIGVVAMGEYNIYDLAAVDICEYQFNPELTPVTSVDSYRHKRTCTTALSEQKVSV